MHKRAEHQLSLYMKSLVVLKETRGYWTADDIKTLVYFARKAQMSSKKISVWKATTTLT